MFKFHDPVSKDSHVLTHRHTDIQTKDTLHASQCLKEMSYLFKSDESFCQSILHEDIHRT